MPHRAIEFSFYLGPPSGQVILACPFNSVFLIDPNHPENWLSTERIRVASDPPRGGGGISRPISLEFDSRIFIGLLLFYPFNGTQRPCFNFVSFHG